MRLIDDVAARVAGVLVLRDPGSGGLASVDWVARTLARVFVVDNSSVPVRLPEDARLRHMANTQNVGVARGFNQGMLAARRAGFRYALLLDQDSVIEMDCVTKLLAAHEDLHDAFITCPEVRYEGTGLAHPQRRVSPCRPVRVNVAISSGSLVDLQRIDEVGPHDEKLFVDFVDFEYCLRAARDGCYTYRVPAAHMRQRLGARREGRLLGIRCHPTHHPPERRYYKTRNALYVWRRYFRSHPRWVLRSMGKLVSEFLQIWLFEDRRLDKTKACTEGIRDFLRGRYGERGRPKRAVGRNTILDDRRANETSAEQESALFAANGRSYGDERRS